MSLVLVMARNWWLRLFFFSLLPLVFTGPAFGQVSVVSDGTFTGADWSETVVNQENGATYSHAQQGSGGNPDDYRRIQHTLVGSLSLVNVAYVYDAFSYDPGVQGAIDTLDYTEDQIIVVSPFGGAAVFAAPALLQNGEIYIGPAITFTDLSWNSAGLLGLTESSFMNGVGSPDFSESGGVIKFGFARANSNSATTTTTNVLVNGIDNWSFTIHSIGPVNSVPAMSPLGLVLLSVILGMAVRSHRRGNTKST